MSEDTDLKPGHYDFTGLGSAEARAEAAQVDADIEGLARDPESAARFREWEEQGLSIDEQIQRLKDFYTRPEYEAAE